MYQIGCIGLCKAAAYYDDSKGYKFSTYAIPMIVGECKRYLRDSSHIIRLSRKYSDILARISKYTNNDPQNITDEIVNKIIEEFGVTSNEIRNIINSEYIQSFSDPIGSEDSISLEDTIQDDNDNFQEIEEQEAIYQAIDNVVNSIKSPLIRDIYTEYIYSLVYGDEKLSQVELASKYNTTQPTISRTIVKYNDKLAKALDYRRRSM
jgi:RNA polymerase sporulation-specific sigma factor